MKPHGRVLRAFSILEMAIVIMIVSALISVSAQTFVKIKEAENRKITKDKLNMAAKMLAAYRKANDSIPCPAGLRFAYGAAKFGSASCTVSSSTGIYRISGTSGDDKELIKGMLPAKDLGMPSSAAIDAWGNKIMYVMRVKESTTTVATGYPSTFEDIEVYDITNLISLSGDKVVYALISTGKEGYGKWPKFSTTANVCTDTTREDDQNCAIPPNVPTPQNHILYHEEYRPNKYDNLIVWRTKAGLDADTNY